MNLCEFEASLVYKASSRTTRAIQRNSVSIKKTKVLCNLLSAFNPKLSMSHIIKVIVFCLTSHFIGNRSLGDNYQVPRRRKKMYKTLLEE